MNDSMQTCNIAVRESGQVKISMPIAKINKERRTVSGWATIDNVDQQGDIITAEAARKAFETFRGNIRLMHQPIPAGKLLKFEQRQFVDPVTGDQHAGIFVDTYISKGANNVWEMVMDGTLTGFSIGGAVQDFEFEKSEDSEEKIRKITKMTLSELSLVDNPANQYANVLSFEKSATSETISGFLADLSVQGVYYCAKDDISYTSKDGGYCTSCGGDAKRVGWIETDTPEEMEKGVRSLIHKYLNQREDELGVNNMPIEKIEDSQETDRKIEKVEEPEAKIEKSEEPVAEKTEETIVEKSEERDEIAERMSKLETLLTEFVENNVRATKSLAGDLDSLIKRIETIEDRSAVKKSADIDVDADEPKVEKSLWGGRFLSTVDIFE